MRRKIVSFRPLNLEERRKLAPLYSVDWLAGKKLINLTCGHTVLRTKLSSDFINCRQCGPKTGSRLPAVSVRQLDGRNVLLTLACGHEVVRNKYYKSKSDTRFVNCEHCNANGLSKGRSKVRLNR